MRGAVGPTRVPHGDVMWGPTVEYSMVQSIYMGAKPAIKLVQFKGVCVVHSDGPTAGHTPCTWFAMMELDMPTPTRVGDLCAIP